MIKVLLFAGLREAVGEGELIINEPNLTVRQLRNYLITNYNVTQVNEAMVAINEEYANEDDLLKDGDHAALIPPVSGG